MVIDVETTIFQKGHPFSPTNRLCAVGIGAHKDSPIILKVEYDAEPYGQNLDTLRRFIDLHDVLVGFNLKFDLHWLRRYGVAFSHKPVWDCQLAQFIIECQTNPYPSLNKAAEFWNLGRKVDAVAEQYWENGIDTPDIPWDLLAAYTKQDIALTRDVAECQWAYLADKPKLQKLIELACKDLLILEEMEWNGIKYDVEASLKLADDLKSRASYLCGVLDSLIGVSGINWNSGDQLSAVLYGGTIRQIRKEMHPFTYKNGRTLHKLKNVEYELKFPRLVQPLKKTELKKPGYWATSADVLHDLKATGKAKKIIELVLELSDIDKQVGTYLQGIPEKIEEYGWEDNTIHGQLNQCVAVTGRLSSSNPNLQNNPHSIDLLFRSRYAD